jgi:intraflagellar transport protein 140
VDEYQNYEKALGALGEASRCLAKVTTPRDAVQHQRALDNLNTRMVLVKRFVDIRRSELSSKYSIGMCCFSVVMSFRHTKVLNDLVTF